MGQSLGKEKCTLEESHSENSEDRMTRKENTSNKRPQRRRFKFGTRFRRERSSCGKKIGNENKEGDGINLKDVEKDFQSGTAETAGIDSIPEQANRTETTLVNESQKDLLIDKREHTQNVIKVSCEPGNDDDHLDCESGKQKSSNPECTEHSGECILTLLKLANGVTSSCSPENVCEEERILLKRRVFQLETPFKWFSEIKLNDEVLSCTNEGCESNEISRDTKAKQDYFHITTFHLCHSAIFGISNRDNHKALKELYQAKLAIKRFALEIEAKGEKSNKFEDVRRDQDILKCLRLVVAGSIAYIAFQMIRYNEVRILLQDIETEGKTPALDGIIKGIQGMTLANFKCALPVSITIIRETIALEPNNWRWHMALSKLLQMIPEPEDPTDKIMHFDEISKELWKVHKLKRNDPVSTISLGDSYCNSLFLVRNLKNSLENYEEYADKAVDAYTTALGYAPHCALTHARVARSLWNMRKQHREAYKKALVAAEKAMAIILTMDINEDAEDRDQLGKVAEAAMLLGLFWESAGNVDKALALFRMAASNPYVHPQVAYRSELGIIIGCFQNDNRKRSHAKTNVLGLLDKLLEKYQDGNHKQQTLCHKGQYLMDVKKDNAAALDEFIKAILINPQSPYLKKFYPRFTTTFSRPVRITDLIHELACKELIPIITKVKKGAFPEATERSKYLNDCIKLAQDSAGTSQSLNPHQSKLEKGAVIMDMKSDKQNIYDNLCGKITENKDEQKPENLSLFEEHNGSLQRDRDVPVAESLCVSKSSNLTDLPDNQNAENIKEVIELVNTGITSRKESNPAESSNGKVTTAMSSIQETINYNRRDEANNDLTGTHKVLDVSKSIESKVNVYDEGKDNVDHHYKKETGVLVVEMIKKKTKEGSQEIGGGDTNNTATNHLSMRETYV